MPPACEIWPLYGQVCSQGSVPLSSVTFPSLSRGPEGACPDSAYSGTGSQVPENLQARPQLPLSGDVNPGTHSAHGNLGPS